MTTTLNLPAVGSDAVLSAVCSDGKTLLTAGILREPPTTPDGAAEGSQRP
ncbi:hypothetical protein GCM10022244_32810 [Streptomyces gulbargensis]|uniref:Uncharacterized protein n=1 Tax=Streptomyces gulbargensis TaxID=364901 RepID=A0ABP7MHB1_9ACTN